MKKLLSCVLAVMLSVGTATARELTDEEKATVTAAVSAHLLDPYSAHFTFPPLAEVEPLLVYCGYVNAKNRFGGYTGDALFVVAFGENGELDPNTVAIAGMEDLQSAVMLQMCQGG